MMATINLKVAQLRRQLGMTQQELGDKLGISYQSVSKWENQVTMPDITQLPLLSRIFEVSVDELLGLKPLPDDFVPSDSGGQTYWADRTEYLKRTRKYYWNSDYMQFLIDRIWNIRQPVKVLDCACGFGFLGMLMLPLLPEGSTYTGIDFSGDMLAQARMLYQAEGLTAEFILADVYEAGPVKQYDIVISQAVLRHVNDGEGFLNRMIGFAGIGGLIVSIEKNREFEADGMYIDGMDYAKLCSHPGLGQMWKTEYHKQGRDYAVAMRVPHYMRNAGLTGVETRMNDRVTLLMPGQEDYGQMLADLMKAEKWEAEMSREQTELEITNLMRHGMEQREAEEYCRQQQEVAGFLHRHREEVAMTLFGGAMVSFGWKQTGNALKNK